MIGALAATLLTVASIVLVATVLGTAALAWCSGREPRSGGGSAVDAGASATKRPDERPIGVAPAIGASVMVLWLSAIGLVMPPGGWFAVSLTVVAVALVVAVTCLRRPDQIRSVLGQWGSLVGPLAVGVLCAAPFLLVVARAGSVGFVHLSGNHDGYFFAAVPQWLTEHSTLGGAGLLSDGSPVGTPLLGSTWDILWNGSWRVGSDVLTSAVSRLAGADAVDVWLPVTLSYLVMAVAAAHALARSFGVSRWRALFIAAAVGSTASMVDAIADQHTPTVLALAVLMALVVELRRGPYLRSGAAAPFLVALTAGGLAAVYSELFTLALLPLGVLVIGPRRPDGRFDRRWLGVVALWSLVLAGPSWVRALVGTVGGNAPEGYRSAFDIAGGWFSALNAFARGAGQPPVTWSEVTAPAALGVALFGAVLVAGLGAAMWRGPGRAWWCALVASTCMWWAALGMVDRSGYPQQRLVEWSVPLLVLGALVGWNCLSDSIGSVLGSRSGSTGRGESRVNVVGAAAFVAAVVVIAAPGLEHARRIEEQPGRRVDDALLVISEWVGSRDPEGSDTLVLATGYLANLWAPYALRSQSETSYLNVYPEYFVVDHVGEVGGHRWLLLDRDAMAAAEVPEASVVESNGRFVLVDLDEGPVTVTVPPSHGGRWSSTGHAVTVVLDHGAAACGAGGVPVRCR